MNRSDAEIQQTLAAFRPPDLANYPELDGNDDAGQQERPIVLEGYQDLPESRKDKLDDKHGSLRCDWFSP